MPSRSIRSAPRRCATSSTSPSQFSPPAEIVTLERNYRSTQPILAAANAVIELAERALHQEPLDRARVRRAAAARHRARRGRPGALRRRAGAGEPRGRHRARSSRRCCSATSHHSGPLEVELTRRNIPFVKFGGLKFLDAAHVKDMLAVLRFAENPRDRVAGFRRAAAPARRRPDRPQRVLDAMAAAGRSDRGARRRSAAAARRRATGRAFVDD